MAQRLTRVSVAKGLEFKFRSV